MEAFINEMVEPRVLDLVVLILPKWRLLVYIFLTNIVLVTPVYVFGALLSNDPELGLICPPIVLIGFTFLHRALFRCGNGRNIHKLLLGVAILSLGISASGLVAMYDDVAHYPLVVLLYGAVGGFGYQLVCTRMWKVMATLFSARTEMFVIQFLHSCGQATSLLVLLAGFQLPWDGYVYGALLLPLTGVVLHLVPLVLLISGERSRLRRALDEFVCHTEKGNEAYYGHVATRAGNVEPAPLTHISREPDTPPFNGEEPPLSWRNPANFSAPRADVPEPSSPSVAPPFDYEYEECEDPTIIQRDGKCFNQDGVEILEMILEEDEGTLTDADDRSVSPADGPTFDGVRSDSDWSSAGRQDPAGKWHRLCQPIRHVTGGARRLWYDLHPSINVQLAFAARQTLADVRCCSCAFLKATDACIFVLFLVILPRFVGFHYPQRARARHMTLLAVVVIASAWAGTSFLLLCCELRFRKQQERLLVFGLLFQAFGYFCVYAIKSSFWTIVGCVLIGAGHSIACCYQEPVLKRQLGQRRWDEVKDGIGFVCGAIVLVIAASANVLYVYGRVDHLLLTLLLIYSAAGALWMISSCRRVIS